MKEETIYDERIGLQDLQEKVTTLKAEIEKVLVGKNQIVDMILVAILSNGHILLEGVPGIAKTLIAKLTAKLISIDFSRIQFTSDLMPSDILGTSIFNNQTSRFEFVKGPIFANTILIDEINRAPAKTQSALFEAMEEYQVTVDGSKYNMPNPFMVIATQNPIEHEGTYRLPEAQLDRFMFKLQIDYPSLEEEVLILKQKHSKSVKTELQEIKPVMTAEELEIFKHKIQDVQFDEKLLEYVATIINKTRNHPSLYIGASPRASINTMYAAKAYAAINGRDFVIPEDIKLILEPVLYHRIYLSPEKELEGIQEIKIIRDIINSVEIPR